MLSACLHPAHSTCTQGRASNLSPFARPLQPGAIRGTARLDHVRPTFRIMRTHSVASVTADCVTSSGCSTPSSLMSLTCTCTSAGAELNTLPCRLWLQTACQLSGMAALPTSRCWQHSSKQGHTVPLLTLMPAAWLPCACLQAGGCSEHAALGMLACLPCRLAEGWASILGL